MKTLIVSILGRLMVPNIQFIKEKRTKDADFLFISDPELEEEDLRQCIKSTFGIDKNELSPIVVDEYDARALEDELKKRKFEQYDKILVNVSEGTIVTANVTVDFFKDYIADIYYIPDTISYMVRIFPKRRQGKVDIKNKINMTEYVTSHGLEMRGGRLSGISMDYIQKMLVLYLAYDNERWWTLSRLRPYRGKKRCYRIDKFPQLDVFLREIEFPLVDQNREYINREEIGFLTGDWFEEYVYHIIKDEFNLSGDNIKTGITLSKDGVINEFDVVFFYNGVLYTIECKTSIKDKEKNIITNTIYKVKALQNNLGHYSDSNIFTLSSRAQGEIRPEHVERGEVFNIDVYCREDILNCQDIPKMLKIKKV
ncbi:MAG: DUF1887 family protein [Tannerella sp.]|jgi:hypothetical protein|nr:DUF1887 family protein [Tannerella sp.]